MKKLILKLIIPLTIISFVVVTKWWDVKVIDGPNEIMYGFPLIYISKGVNSMSYQFFFLEFIFDFFIYFLLWFIVIYFINRLNPIPSSKKLNILSIILSGIAGIFICLMIFFFTSFDVSLFLARKSGDEKIIKTGHHFIWED